MIWKFIGEKLHTSLERYREKGLIITPTTEDFCLWVDGHRLDTVLNSLQEFVHSYVAVVVAYAVAEKLNLKEIPNLECTGFSVALHDKYNQPKEIEDAIEEIIELLS